jgi:hypothetical protein
MAGHGHWSSWATGAARVAPTPPSRSRTTAPPPHHHAAAYAVAGRLPLPHHGSVRRQAKSGQGDAGSEHGWPEFRRQPPSQRRAATSTSTEPLRVAPSTPRRIHTRAHRIWPQGASLSPLHDRPPLWSCAINSRGGKKPRRCLPRSRAGIPATCSGGGEARVSGRCGASGAGLSAAHIALRRTTAGAGRHGVKISR